MEMCKQKIVELKKMETNNEKKIPLNLKPETLIFNFVCAIFIFLNIKN